MDYTTLLFIAGIVILTMSLMLNYFKRQKLEAERQTKRRAAAEAAKEAERKRQLRANEPVKIKSEKSYSSVSDRISFTDPLGKPFSGSFTPRNIAQWELEIDKLGRQWAGTLDSKMIALQTLTQEANRVANRVELLLEQFEQLIQPRTEPKTVKIENSPPENVEEIISAELPDNSVTETLTELLVEQPNLIPANEANAMEYQTKPLVLDDLETEIDRLQQQIADEAFKLTPATARATILKIDDSIPITSSKPPEPNEEPSSPTISISAFGSPGSVNSSANSSGNLSRDHYVKPSYPLDSSLSGSRRITVSPSLAMTPMGNLSFDSLYDDQPAKRNSETIVAKSTVSELSAVSLNLQKQVEMLHNYGYTPRQIAQSLNITVSEVDLMLK